LQQLPQRHLVKLQFNSPSVAQGEAAWQAYLQGLDITSHQAVKLLTEAALLGSAIEQGLSPDLIILSDGAKQFAILVHALCWVHMERGIRRLPGNTAFSPTGNRGGAGGLVGLLPPTQGL